MINKLSLSSRIVKNLIGDSLPKRELVCSPTRGGQPRPMWSFNRPAFRNSYKLHAVLDTPCEGWRPADVLRKVVEDGPRIGTLPLMGDTQREFPTPS